MQAPFVTPPMVTPGMENLAMIRLEMPLVLGSRSPRRVELLGSVGLEVIGRPCDVDESPLSGEDPRGYVQRIVQLKLDAARAGEPALPAGPYAVLVADTTVTIDGHILGKPADGPDAVAMLTRLAGRTHEVLTCYGLAVLHALGSSGEAGAIIRTVATRVTMRVLSTPEIAGYVASGEPFGKAGAYAIQGLGALLVQRIDGSYTGVVGLPICEVVQDLLGLGVVAPADREHGA